MQVITRNHKAQVMLSSFTRYLLLVVLLFSVIQTTNAASTFSESEIKAAMLLKMVRYVEFPENISTNDEYLKICIAGEHDIYNALRKNQLTQHNNKQREFVTVKIDQDTSIDNCDLLFLSSSLGEDFLTILDQALEQPILTIADSRNAAEQGVMLNFIPKRNFIGFEINPEAARKVNLKFSSELLKLGLIKQTKRITQDTNKQTNKQDFSGASNKLPRNELSPSETSSTEKETDRGGRQ